MVAHRSVLAAVVVAASLPAAGVLVEVASVAGAAPGRLDSHTEAFAAGRLVAGTDVGTPAVAERLVAAALAVFVVRKRVVDTATVVAVAALHNLRAALVQAGNKQTVCLEDTRTVAGSTAPGQDRERTVVAGVLVVDKEPAHGFAVVAVALVVVALVAVALVVVALVAVALVVPAPAVVVERSLQLQQHEMEAIRSFRALLAAARRYRSCWADLLAIDHFARVFHAHLA